MKPTILLVEDEIASRFGFVRYFWKEGYDIVEAADITEATGAFKKQRFDAIVLDMNLPDGNGLDFIDTVRSQDTSVPIILVTGEGDIPLAVDAMRRGANDFLTKPVNNANIAVFLRKVLEIGALKKQQTARQRLQAVNEIFFGNAPAMREILEIAQVAAANGSALLITGETGTGKGMLAKWVHRKSDRGSNEFVELNCSGLRGDLLAREIFGNARGAFTSADQDRKGLLDIADKSTLFLDEIGTMGMDVQAQFLKVLEDKSYRRLGDVKLLRSDFRLISATNLDISQLAQQGLFRKDLLYRINLMEIQIPPLRERMEDLPDLVSYLLRGMGSTEEVVTKEVMNILSSYSWPGNVRELKNVLERALLLSPKGEQLKRSHFAGLENRPSPAINHTPQTAQEVEMSHILSVLEQMGGDVNKTASVLNVSRATLYRRLKQIRDQKP